MKVQGFFRGDNPRQVGSRAPSDEQWRVGLEDKMGLDCGSFENQTEESDFYFVCDVCRQHCYLPTQ